MTTSLQPVFDKQEQLDQIQEGLLPGETVVAVYDGIGIGTGFIGLTSLRAIFQDNSFMGKKTAITSVPYSRIVSVSMTSDQQLLTKGKSSIAIATSDKSYEVDFRGWEKAKHAHDHVLWAITKASA